MRRTMIGLAVGAALLCAVTPSAGGIYEKGWEFSLMGGGQIGDSDAEVDRDVSYNLRIAYALTPKIEIEFAYGKFDTTRDITGSAGDPSSPTAQVDFSETGDTEFTYYSLGLTANFLTETDSSTLPYISVGLGSAEERRDGRQFCIDLIVDANPWTCADILPDGRLADPSSGIQNPTQQVSWQTELDRRDTGTLLTLGGGARTFLVDWFAVRYEVRYYHHDTFEINQDAFEISVGASFVVGGRR